MKTKFAIIALTISVFTSSVALAEQGQSGENSGENFAKHKAEIIANLNQEKAVIDQAISCINSAQNKETAMKCHEQKRASMEQMKQQRMAKRKEHLQDQINKIDQKSNQMSAKGMENSAAKTGTSK
ncbi:MAG: hypothetical protein K0R25_1198 [Rickettsiaceae bacterium]|jgi:hypothetical protein|nr:hypothetical protein [Rickettsiaceae bacterium]